MSGETEIRPFRVDLPAEAIADLRRLRPGLAGARVRNIPGQSEMAAVG
jgi:hypothetical protein